jgi:putative YphP/YqiW family bacilliredoxin
VVLFLLSNKQKNMPYPEMLVAPMRSELTGNGFAELRNAADVDAAFSNKEGTALVVVNSVCGCAAGAARPGILKSLSGEFKPDRLFTVFAGQDTEATARVREYMAPYPPSSPAVALFKNGELVHMVERHMIEGRTADMVADNLQSAYSMHCAV